MNIHRPAVFLDKDGTLIEDVPYNVDPALMRLTSGAVEGVRTLHRAGYALVVISNQSGVARGYFAEEAIVPVRERLEAMLGDFGVPLTGFYYCPHHPEGVAPGYAIACRCRKPSPGMVRDACRDLGIDPGRSWFVGDILDDVEAGRRAGCRTVLLDVGHETRWVRSPLRRPDLTAPDLASAARLILAADGMAGA